MGCHGGIVDFRQRNNMKPVCRSYQTEDDFWSMREFLRQVFVINHQIERSWHVARLDYARWHSCLNCAGVRLEDVAFLWEASGHLLAILMPDGGLGEAHLLVHPLLRTLELEEDMLGVAEGRLAAVMPDGSHKLCVW
jgi:mycothiol synthase